MTAESELLETGPDRADSLRRSYLTALTLLGDAPSAEALVMEAIENLEEVTSRAIRDSVIRLLVRELIKLKAQPPFSQDRPATKPSSFA
jgi:hypothetical protein